MPTYQTSVSSFNIVNSFSLPKIEKKIKKSEAEIYNLYVIFLFLRQKSDN